jgi:hypothetical protein
LKERLKAEAKIIYKIITLGPDLVEKLAAKLEGLEDTRISVKPEAVDDDVAAKASHGFSSCQPSFENCHWLFGATIRCPSTKCQSPKC